MSNDAAIQAKLKGMRKKMMSRGDIDELFNASSIQGFYNELTQHESYQRAANSLATTYDTREDLEVLIELAFFEDFLKIYRFVDLDIRRFLTFYNMTFEAHIIKRIFKNISLYHESLVTLHSFTNFLEDKRHIHVTELIMAATIEQAIACFDDSIYHTFFERNTEIFRSENFNHYLFENLLDQFVAQQLWIGAKHFFSTKEIKAFKKYFGSEFDIININTIYRLKFYYDVDETTILSSLIPEYYRLSEPICNQLITAANETEFVNIVSQLGYGDIYEDGFNIETIHQTQQTYLNFLRSRITKQHHTTLFEIIKYLDDKFNEGAFLINKLERMAYGKYSAIERSFS